jgi:hypothetical protein
VLGAVADESRRSQAKKTEPTELEHRVLALAAGAPTFLDVLDQLPESDVTIARAVEALLRRGAIEAH